MSKSPITCHVLDSSTGRPAAGVGIRLQEFRPVTNEGGMDSFILVSTGVTDADGRCTTLLSPPESMMSVTKWKAGIYKIIFETKEYFENTGKQTFYPWVDIVFEVRDTDEHYHIPLLISPFSYTTYRGS